MYKVFKALKVHTNAKQNVFLLVYAKFTHVQVYLRMLIGACVWGFSEKSIEFFTTFLQFQQFDVNTEKVGQYCKSWPRSRSLYVSAFSTIFAPKGTIVAFCAV